MLAKMHLPQLSMTNGVAGPITYVNGGNLSYYIDGMQASEGQIQAILPRDVLKIEVLFAPTDPRFKGDKYVVNYILRHYEFGGYTMLSVEQDATKPKGRYSVFSKLEYKKSTFNVYGSFNFESNQKLKSEEFDTFRMNGSDGDTYELKKESSSATGKNLKNQFLAGFLWEYLDMAKSLNLSVEGGISGSNLPDRIVEGKSSYNLPGYGDMDYTDKRKFHHITPSLSISLNKQISNKDYLHAKALFAASITDNERRYTTLQSPQAIENKTEEHSYNPAVSVYFRHLFNQNHSFNISLSEIPQFFKSTYAGTDNSIQKLLNNSVSAKVGTHIHQKASASLHQLQLP